MKNLICILMFMFPIILYAQQPRDKFSPMDYTWQNVGNEGLSAGLAVYTSLAFSSSGQPYLAFQDWGNSKKVSVMTFNGTNWVNVGSAGFSAGVASDEKSCHKSNRSALCSLYGWDDGAGNSNEI